MHSPELIREALAWLYGVEFRDGEAQYWATDSSVHVWFRESDSRWMLDHDHWDEDITDRIQHALAVTAPWEWKKLEHLEETWRVQDPCIEGDAWFVARDDRWYAALNIYGMSICANDEVVLTSREEAKEFVRNTYLTWMRGRLALKGLPNG